LSGDERAAGHNVHASFLEMSSVLCLCLGFLCLGGRSVAWVHKMAMRGLRSDVETAQFPAYLWGSTSLSEGLGWRLKGLQSCCRPVDSDAIQVMCI
jgi:hypothetical protein